MAGTKPTEPVESRIDRQTTDGLTAAHDPAVPRALAMRRLASTVTAERYSSEACEAWSACRPMRRAKPRWDKIHWRAWVAVSFLKRYRVKRPGERSLPGFGEGTEVKNCE